MGKHPAFRLASAVTLLALTGCASTYDADYYGRTDRYGDYWYDDRDAGRYAGAAYDEAWSPYHAVLWPSYSRYYDPWYQPSYAWRVGFWSAPRYRRGWDYRWHLSYRYDPWIWSPAFAPWRDPWYDRWWYYGLGGYVHQGYRYRDRRYGGNTDWRHGHRDGWRHDRTAREEAERQAWRDRVAGYEPPAPDAGDDAARGELERGGFGGPTAWRDRERGDVGRAAERGGARAGWREDEPWDRAPSAAATVTPEHVRYSGQIERHVSAQRWDDERARPDRDPGVRAWAEPGPARGDAAAEAFGEASHDVDRPVYRTLPPEPSGWPHEPRGRAFEPVRETTPAPRFERDDGGDRGFDRASDRAGAREQLDRFERRDESGD